jgi:hypothetical protein
MRSRITLSAKRVIKRQSRCACFLPRIFLSSNIFDVWGIKSGGLSWVCSQAKEKAAATKGGAAKAPSTPGVSIAIAIDERVIACIDVLIHTCIHTS